VTLWLNNKKRIQSFGEIIYLSSKQSLWVCDVVTVCSLDRPWDWTRTRMILWKRGSGVREVWERYRSNGSKIEMKMEGEDYMDVMGEFKGWITGSSTVWNGWGGKSELGNVFKMKALYFNWGPSRVDCNLTWTHKTPSMVHRWVSWFTPTRREN